MTNQHVNPVDCTSNEQVNQADAPVLGKMMTGQIRQRNRLAIMQAAEAEFSCHGFRGATVQAIAERAGLPKANILYYFGSKAGLYRELLGDILSMWNQAFDNISEQDEPAEAIGRYIRAKLRYSRSHPQRSRIFAMEVMQGAPNLKRELHQPMVSWTRKKADLLQSWIDQGRIVPIAPLHLLFLIWGATQFYADYAAEIELIYEQAMDDAEYGSAELTLISVILRGIGLTPTTEWQ